MKMLIKYSIIWVSLGFLIVAIFASGYQYHQALNLDVIAQNKIKIADYKAAYNTYVKAYTVSYFNHSVAQHGEKFSIQMMDSQNFLNLGILDLKKSDFTNALKYFALVLPSYPQYKLAQADILEVNATLGDIANSKKYYKQGINDYSAKNWQLAINNFSRVIKLDSEYQDAQGKIMQAQKMLLPASPSPQPISVPILNTPNPIFQYPSIASEQMSSAIALDGSPTAVSSSFNSGISSLYAVLLLKNCTPNTLIAYTRYYNGNYIDSAQSNPSSSNISQYFYFNWNKNGTYPSGSYELKFYINGYYIVSLNYIIN